MIAVKNKTQVWVFAGIKKIEGRLPFSILGLDSDNGSEFINTHLLRYCEQNQITFTRSRPYRKNDSCFIEQKNYSVIRRAVGYSRYDTDYDLAILNELYSYLRL
jgi:transposase InsO family protein